MGLPPRKPGMKRPETAFEAARELYKEQLRKSDAVVYGNNPTGIRQRYNEQIGKSEERNLGKGVKPDLRGLSPEKRLEIQLQAAKFPKSPFMPVRKRP